MSDRWHGYERQVRLAGFLIITVVMVQNVMLTWLFFQAKHEARRQLEGRLALAAEQSRLIWAAAPPPPPDSVVARWRRLNQSAGCTGTIVFDRHGRLALSTDSLSAAGAEGPLAGIDAASYRRLDETGAAASAVFLRGRQPLVRQYLRAGMGGGILAVESRADFLHALEGVAAFELWSSVILLLLVAGLSVWYFNNVLAPFRQMAAAARQTLGGERGSYGADVALVMDVYQRAVDDLRTKGRTLQQLYDQAKSGAERSEAVKRRILDSLDKGVITLDGDGRVTSHNAAAARMAGSPDGEVVGRWLAGSGIAARADGQRAFDWEPPAPDGSLRTLQVEQGPLDDEGGRVLILSDVTGVRTLEAQAALYDRSRWLAQAARQLSQRVGPLLDALRGGRDAQSAAGTLAGIERAIADFSTTLGYFPDGGQPTFSQEIVHRSPAMERVLDLVAKVAPSESTVLITGESGTGKELLAREIHRLSQRRGGPFVSLNCGALPETLLESELFGYVKGAFTGALRDKPGLLKAAQGGTFFLDEVADLSPALQVKLLRVVQEREVTPVGATAATPVDIRLVAATNRELSGLVADGTFRQDLYFRLNVFPITVPPLRERPEDIAPLAESILRKLAGRTGRDLAALSEGARRVLAAHRWPGNVREMENLLERALLMTSGPLLEPEHLDLRQGDAGEHSSGDYQGEGLLVVSARAAAEAEARLIKAVLEEVGGNKSEAARRLKISYRVMLKKIKDYNLV
ncbi:MAG: sigma 54-interacting transcriptional regulator [Candidatus Edwardsbacteria bacterium]|jgi:two-component system response regulator AtoC|nr:sigma 54-interacting transcriptional regulator [Candidatus Edwardsbacteria bacterium]